MDVISSVKQLRSSGKSDVQIIDTLREQGITPREINDALSRSRIKEAVGEGQENYGNSQNTNYNMQTTQEIPQPMGSQENMQPSLMNQENYENQEYPTPYPGSYNNTQYSQSDPYAQNYQNDWQSPPMQYPGNYPAQENKNQQEMPMPESYGQYSDQDYVNQGYPQQYNAINNEMVVEIASQIMDNKIGQVTKTLNSLNEMKTLLDAKVSKIDERVARMESIMDALQTSLLRKTNEHEQNISDIKSELQGMQTGFSKVLNPLTDKIREIDEIKKNYKRK